MGKVEKAWAGHGDLLVFAAAAVVFMAFGGVDLKASGLFFRPGEGFFLEAAPAVRFVHEAIPYVAPALTALLGVFLLLGCIPRLGLFGKFRKEAVYLLLVLGLGPGLVVNQVFKEHWGRARPAAVREFGGDKTFTPAFAVSDQCRRNCSFVSGHAAQGFYFCALGFLARRRRLWFAAGLGMGGAVGLARMAQGKHFLSDIVFAFFFVYFSAKLLHFLLWSPASPLQRLRAANPAKEAPAEAGP
jgi:lipid A 4'-phosphatase